MDTFSKDIKHTRVSNAVAAGTTDVESTSVDMADFDSVAFTVAFGAIVSGAVTSVKLQGSANNSTWVDLEGTSITVADTDDNDLVISDQIRPNYRYVRCVVDRGTQNATIDVIIAHQYAARFLPVTQPATTLVETHVASVAGTA